MEKKNCQSKKIQKQVSNLDEVEKGQLKITMREIDSFAATDGVYEKVTSEPQTN